MLVRGRQGAAMYTGSAIELLESRIAPAVVIANGGRSATYTDVDGDHVTITVSTGGLTLANFSSVPGPFGVGDQVEKLDLTAMGFEGANVTVAVAKSATGDGLVNIGAIDASGRNLGVVKIPGDLGQIDAGNAAAGKAALGSFTVDSLGRLGLATQEVGGSLESDIDGALGSLSVKHDVVAAFVKVSGNIGKVTIGGSLLGGTANDSGEIQGEDIGAVKITGDIIGGSSGTETGGVNALGKLTSASIGHSILGGFGNSKSGFITAVSDIGKVTIGGDLEGGAATGSGEITSSGKITSLSVKGSVRGDLGANSGYIVGATLGTVKIGRDLIGGNSSGNNAGGIAATGAGAGQGSIGSVVIGGAAVGGLGNGSAFIFSMADIGSVKIGGNLAGGPANNSGSISSGGAITSVTIGGSLLGGSSVSGQSIAETGCILAKTLVAKVSIAGNIVGGSSANHSALTDSGIIEGTNSTRTSGSVGQVTVGGSILQGYIENSSDSSANFLGGIFAGEDIGQVSVKHDIVGGFVAASRNLAGVTLGGSLVGQSIVGGNGYNKNGFLGAQGTVGPIKIGGSVIGGNADDSTMTQTGCIAGGRLTSVKIAGSLVAGMRTNGGSLTLSGAIVSLNDIGSISIGGNVVGSSTNRVAIIARGQATQGAGIDVAIAGISIGGRVEMTDIIGGYTVSSAGAAPTNADAQIGAVKVKGSWTASNLVAGATNTNAPNFGDSHDAAISGGSSSISSKIASITIGGPVYGTPTAVSGADSFGFVAQVIGPVKIAGLKLTPSSGNGTLVSSTGDVFVHELS